MTDERPSAAHDDAEPMASTTSLEVCRSHGATRRMNTAAFVVEWHSVAPTEVAALARRKVVAILARLSDHGCGSKAATSEPQ